MERILVMKQFLKLIVLITGTIALFFASAGLATPPTGVSLGAIASNVGTSVTALAKILEDISLVAGVGFIMASFFKFHQHKLNPQQVPMSQGITLLLVGAGLAVFPHLIPTASHAVFGSAAAQASVGSSPI